MTKIKNWLMKADNDLKVANNEINMDEPVTDVICFHAQQCVEKYLKAYLVFNDIEFRKTHNIAELIELCKEKDPEFSELYRLRIQELTAYATELRYPEYFYIPSLEEAKEAINMAERVKDFVLKKLEGDKP